MQHSELQEFIRILPKTELHLHLEGSFEPELMFEIAERNNISIPFESIEEIKQAYKFNNLQAFLDIYYQGAQVLITEQDFYDLTWAYLERVHAQNVVHVEVFFDPQTHTERGVPFSTVIKGIRNALEDGQKKMGISSFLIMSYLRHLSEESAKQTLKEALPYKSWIKGVGLDSSELGNPPSKFKEVFKMSIEEGFLPVAHAGEEGPASYIWEALDVLKVVRIDHGNRCLEDETLVKRLLNEKMALTLCPLSNLELKVIQKMEDHPLKKMLDMGLLATIHSDDPAYFGGYMNENFLAVSEALNLSKQEIAQLSINAFEASWLPKEQKERMISQIKNML